MKFGFFRALARFRYLLFLGMIILINSVTVGFIPNDMSSAYAQSKKPLVMPKLERARVQNRFQARVRRSSLNTQLGAHIRDDYYDSFASGLGLEYFFSDQWGIGLNYTCLWTSLSDEASELRNSYGLVPDARPQQEHLSISALYGLGYGKMLLFDHIVHFDPIFAMGLGYANAEERTLPMFKFAFAPTFLLQNGWSLRLDLAMTAQLENRSRGVVFTTGFMPMLTVGWSRQLWTEKLK